MADPLVPNPGPVPTEALAPESAPVGAVVPPQRASASGKGFGGRFLVVYLLLGLVLGAAVGGLVVALTKPGHTDGPAWSIWKPEGDDTQKAQQIADHVGPAYRLPSGQQLVGIQATPPRIQDVPIGAIAIRHLPTESTGEPPVNVLAPEDTVVFIMCGLGENCSIAEGNPSVARLRLLRREALELALYTFRYVDGFDRVVAFLPPAPGNPASFALFFERGPVEPELGKPLQTTLSPAVPPSPGDIAPSEVATIDRLTSSNFYRFTFQQLQDGTAVLVLDDPRLPVESTDSSSTGSGSSDSQSGTSTDGGATTTSTGSQSESGS